MSNNINHKNLLAFMHDIPHMITGSYIICRYNRPMKFDEKVTALPYLVDILAGKMCNALKVKKIVTRD